MTKSSHQLTSNRTATRTTLLVRTDADQRLGIGHLMRCISIAAKWVETGGEVTFLLTPLSEQLSELLTPHPFQLEFCNVERGSAQDAEHTATLANQLGADWILADGYWFGPEFQRIVASAKARLMLIDALGAPQYNSANLILNANIYANEQYYRDRAPHTELLLGLDYLPLNRAFTQTRRNEARAPDDPPRVLISLGGGDPDNITGRILTLLEELPVAGAITVIIGPANQNFQALDQMAQQSRHQIHLVQSPKNMPELMQQADAAILAGGSTVWEALYMGVPTLLMSYADNQIRVASKLDELELCLYAGHMRGEIPQTLNPLLETLLSDMALRERLTKRGQQLIDGRGIERILTKMRTQKGLTP